MNVRFIIIPLKIRGRYLSAMKTCLDSKLIWLFTDIERVGFTYRFAHY
ncbi:Putative uncharacterized protein [Moritella viscosa]|uniref:Uncharacterized protein n=1 Tax=Moritella viscosa TaxID=80854 RepID=A0ABY1HI51_9GAMM|nr:Putative uncharacterized protein [Moritella viscosa]